MKILILNQAFFPDNVATAQHCTDLAKHLAQQGHEVGVIADRRAYENRSTRFSPFQQLNGIQIYRVLSTGFGKGTLIGRVIDALSFELFLFLRLLTIGRYDVILCFSSPPLVGLIALIYQRLRGGRLFQWVMDVNPETAIALGILKKDSLITKLLLGAYRLILRQSHGVIVLDRWMKTTVKKHGIPEEKIFIVPPWPIQTLKAPQGPWTTAQDNPFRKKYNLESKFIVLYSGNHSLAHPLDTLLNAALLLRDQKNIHFVFAGNGVRVSDVSKFISANQLDNVLQLPYQPREKLGDLLAMANLHVIVLGENVSGFVHPSKIYGVLASGHPYVAISPKESFLYDILRQCPYGFHVVNGESESLVSAIKGAMQLTPSDIKQYAERNFQFVMEHFNPQNILNEVASSVLGLSKGNLHVPLKKRVN